MKVSFEGIGEQVATFEAVTTGAGAVTPGCLVKMAADGKVGACTSAGDIPAGVAQAVHHGYAAVQLKGYAKVPCASSVTVGWKAVASDANGKLAVPASGASRDILVVDVAGGVAGIIL